MRPVLVVRNLLCSEGKVLLGLRKETGLWELPGGKVDYESVVEAAVRENLEETSVRLLGEPECLGYYDGFSLKNPDRRFCDIILRWHKWSGEARVMERSHAKWDWYEKGDMHPRLLMPSTRHFYERLWS